jgi:hypothetical protein
MSDGAFHRGNGRQRPSGNTAAHQTLCCGLESGVAADVSVDGRLGADVSEGCDSGAGVLVLARVDALRKGLQASGRRREVFENEDLEAAQLSSLWCPDYARTCSAKPGAPSIWRCIQVVVWPRLWLPSLVPLSLLGSERPSTRARPRPGRLVFLSVVLSLGDRLALCMFAELASCRASSRPGWQQAPVKL